jgi:hypothetical protein
MSLLSDLNLACGVHHIVCDERRLLSDVRDGDNQFDLRERLRMRGGAHHAR